VTIPPKRRCRFTSDHCPLVDTPRSATRWSVGTGTASDRYTTKPLVCPFPDLPRVGYARTVTIRSVLKSRPAGGTSRPGAAANITNIWVHRLWAAAITGDPQVSRRRVGSGAFWCEGPKQRSQGLGCLGVITDGSIRDIRMGARFQGARGSIGPSHAWVHAKSFCGEVRVSGNDCAIRLALHATPGAIVIPTYCPEAADGSEGPADSSRPPLSSPS